MRLLVLAEAAQWICPLASLADYKKDFDMVDHVTLLRKLEAYNLDKKRFNLVQIIFNWLYSTGFIHGSVWTVTAGVQQGSWLGPFLSVMFINDLSTVILTCPCSGRHICWWHHSLPRGFQRRWVGNKQQTAT